MKSRLRGSEFGVDGLGSRVEGLKIRFGFWDSGFRVQVFGFIVKG